MWEFNYIKSEKGWPLSATGKGIGWKFSGSFDPAFNAKHLWSLRFDLFQKTLAWILSVSGLAAAAIQLFVGLSKKESLGVLEPSGYWLIFWIGCFAATFLWAKNRQASQEETGHNLQKTLFKAFAEKTPVDIYELFTPQAKVIWQRSSQPELLNGLEAPGITQLFLSLLKDASVRLVFARFRSDTRDIETIVKNYSAIQGLQLDKSALEMMPFVALQESIKLHNRSIDPLMLLCSLASLLPEDHIIQSILLNLNISQEKLETASAWVFEIDLLKKDWQAFKKLSGYKPDSEINAGLTSLPTYHLDRYSQDLTYLAKHGGLPWALGRGADISEIIKLASEGSKRIVIRGATGSGRTTLVNELAFKMASEQVPPIFADKRLVKLEISALLGNPGKSESILLDCLNEAVRSSNIVIVIEELEQLAQVRSSSGLTLLEILTDYLQNHSLPLLATTTQESYTEFIKNTSNFESIFTVYELSPLSYFQTMLACCVRVSLLEAKHHCFFHFTAIETAVKLTSLYVKDLDQPQKAISILVEAAGQAGSSKRRIVSEELIQKIISQKTHIPSQSLEENESQKLLNLESEIGKFVIGQSAAIQAVSEGLRRARSGLSESSRPLGSFLFLGPTGVGKTEIAKTLAKVYFGDPKLLLRLDMSEYRGTQALEKFLGSRSGTDSTFVAHLKNYPYCLILLDEFEKADKGIHNLFLQILDDGRLTSGKGQTLDLTQCLIIATSNAGSQQIQSGLKSGLSYDQIKSRLVNETLGEFFAPELINRFDSVVVFSSLSPSEVEKVALLQLSALGEELFKKGLKISFSREVLADIAQHAYDPQFGARPVRRYIQDHLESFIAKLLLSKKYARGSAFTIGLKNGKYSIT